MIPVPKNFHLVIFILLLFFSFPLWEKSGGPNNPTAFDIHKKTLLLFPHPPFFGLHNAVNLLGLFI
jgi:hypothetical protein